LTAAGTSFSTAGSAEVVAAAPPLELELELELDPALWLAPDDDDDELLLPHAAMTMAQSADSATSSHILDLRIQLLLVVGGSGYPRRPALTRRKQPAKS
jgi:hypothetical protein